MITKSKKEIIGAIMENYDEFIEKAGEFNEITNKIGLDYNLNLNNSSQLDKEIQRKADEIRNNVFKIRRPYIQTVHGSQQCSPAGIPEPFRHTGRFHHISVSHDTSFPGI